MPRDKVSMTVAVRVPKSAPYYENLASLPHGQKSELLKKAMDMYFGADPLSAMLEEFRSLKEIVSQLKEEIHRIGTEQEGMREEIRDLLSRIQTGSISAVSVPQQDEIKHKPQEEQKESQEMLALRRKIMGTSLAGFTSIASVDRNK